MLPPASKVPDSPKHMKEVFSWLESETKYASYSSKHVYILRWENSSSLRTLMITLAFQAWWQLTAFLAGHPALGLVQHRNSARPFLNCGRWEEAGRWKGRRQGGKSPETCFASMDDTGLWILETKTERGNLGGGKEESVAGGIHIKNKNL